GDYLRYVDINASGHRSMPALSRRRPAAVSLLPDITSIVVGLRRIVRALEVYSHEVRRTYGLTAPQLWALKTLAKTGPLTTGQLAQVLLIHPSSASLLVDRLERRGLVNRVRLQNDRRFVRIELTERAVSLCAVAPEPTQGRLLYGLGGMPSKRLRAIRRAVDDLVGAMEAQDVDARFFFSEG
ncbi:MAG TPA: MarR family transcriptional regulator, partial [Gemmatimonadales bacterium]|nr:MarR family transcriptional regulator [Gemmatimonadales bacterium]